MLIQPRVERTLPEPGATGDVPLGPVPLTLTANLDYAPPQWGPVGSLPAVEPPLVPGGNDRQRDYLPALTTIAAGVRYHWTLRARPWTLRLDGFNLTDAHGLHLSSLESVLPEEGRRFMLTLVTDQ